MRWLVAIVFGLLPLCTAQAQLRGTVPGLPVFPGQNPWQHGGGFGGVNGDQFFQSQVQHAVDQLLGELARVQREVSRMPTNLPVKVELNRLSGQAVREGTALRQLATTTADRTRLLLADQRLDAVMDTLIARINQLLVPSPALADAVARAQFADQQLHAVLGITADTGVADIIRTAQLLIDQVEYIRGYASDRVPGYTPQIDREVRRFSFRIDRLRRNLEVSGNLTTAGADYQLAHQQWIAGRPTIAALTATDPQLRIAAARAETMFIQLGQQLQLGGGVVVPPIVPGPGDPGFGYFQRGLFACGAGEEGAPRVCLFNQLGGAPIHDFFAYEQSFRGGVRVAVADVTGDGIPDLVTAPGGAPAGGFSRVPTVRVFDGRTLRLISEFMPYDRGWNGGVFVAATDLSRNGRAMIVTGADVGAGPHVKAFDVVTGRELASFFAYDPNFRGGVRVALGDVDGDGLADIITSPGPQHLPQIRVFSGVGARPIADFLAFDGGHQVGAYVACADVQRNGRAEVIVSADVGGCGLVRVFDPIRGVKLGEVSPYPAKFRGGIRVAAYDVNNDGVRDIVCAPGPFTPAPVRVFDGRNSKPLVEFLPFEPTFGGGAFIAAR